MRNGASRTALLAGVAFGVLAAGIGEATAGGFAVREQSTYGQGASFAGIAAGGALSGMFWNPAVMTQFGGINAETGVAGIFPNSKHTPEPTSTLFVFGGAGNSGDSAAVPSVYASWQVRPDVWLGLSVNSPFGLSVTFPNIWAGRNYAGNTDLKTYNATPSLALRINNWLSVGAGVQIMYGKAELNNGLPIVPGAFAKITGNGWAYGFTAGVTVTPGPSTQIGLGWRSAMDLDIDGTLELSAPLPSSAGPVSTKLRLPDIVSLGLRHKLSQQFTVMGTVEWSNWSRIGTSAVNSAGGPALILGAPITLPFEYSDGWFFSIGGEYAYSDTLTLRAGVGYEISPITDRVRTPRLPDNDRVWTSVGLSYKPMANLSVDLAYTHIFVDDTPVNVGPGNPWFNPGLPIIYNGSASSHVDILSLGVRYRFNPPPPALVTKG